MTGGDRTHIPHEAGEHLTIGLQHSIGLFSQIIIYI
jgi:hypothetical protein